MPIKVAIVEDNLKFLDMISLCIQASPVMEILGQYTTGKEAVRGMISKKPDVALIDLGLPDISGVDVIRAIVEKNIHIELLILTIYDDDNHLLEALKAGAGGYIVKDAATVKEVPRAVREAVNGGAPMSLGIAKRVLRKFREVEHTPSLCNMQILTKRENQILKQLSKGYPPVKVAESLFISCETIRTHQKNIYRKLQVNSLIEAVALFTNR